MNRSLSLRSYRLLRRHFIQSTSFSDRFSHLKETSAFNEVVEYARGGKGGPLGTADIILSDDNGDHHIFEFESFSFHRQTLTLSIYLRVKSTSLNIAIRK